MMDDKYWPADITELEDRPSLINEPVPPDNVTTIVRGERRSLHAVLVESLKQHAGFTDAFGASWRERAAE